MDLAMKPQAPSHPTLETQPSPISLLFIRKTKRGHDSTWTGKGMNYLAISDLNGVGLLEFAPSGARRQ